MAADNHPLPSAYSQQQVGEYFDYVGLPPKDRPSAGRNLDADLLKTLHVYQIGKIPYENLSLHYSKDGKVELDPQAIYNKFVTRNGGRGGYCMENSIFFNHILCAIGFNSYTAGVRIRLRDGGVPQGPFTGWRHVVNIVTLTDGSKYMLDVGFGGDGATKPLPLIDGHEEHNLGTQYIRLVHSNIPEQTNTSIKYWIYQYRNSASGEWNPYYAFPELEFFESDFAIINYWVSNCSDSFQVHTPLVIKFIRHENEIVAKLMLIADVVKSNEGGKTKLVEQLTSEVKRVDALKNLFGIYLTAEEIQGVVARFTAIQEVSADQPVDQVRSEKRYLRP